MTGFLRRTGAWSAALLVAFAVLAAIRIMTRGTPPGVSSARLVGALLEQAGTFLPFTAYAGAVGTAAAEPSTARRRRGWVWAAALFTGAFVLVLLTASGALGPRGAAVASGGRATTSWESHTRAAAGVFAVLAVALGERIGRWLGQGAAGPRSRPAWEPWALALVLLFVYLGAQGASWLLTTRYGVPPAWAVWGATLPVPLTLWAGWTLPGLAATSSRMTTWHPVPTVALGRPGDR